MMLGFIPEQGSFERLLVISPQWIQWLPGTLGSDIWKYYAPVRMMVIPFMGIDLVIVDICLECYRQKRLKQAALLLKQKGVKALYSNIINATEWSIFEQQGIMPAEETDPSPAGLYQAFIQAVQGNEMMWDVRIWGADTPEGFSWLNQLLPLTNRLSIGGDDHDILIKLVHMLRSKHGYACMPVTQPANFFNGCDIAVVIRPLTMQSLNSISQDALVIWDAPAQQPRRLQRRVISGGNFMLDVSLPIQLVKQERIHLARAATYMVTGHLNKPLGPECMEKVLTMLEHTGWRYIPTATATGNFENLDNHNRGAI